MLALEMTSEIIVSPKAAIVPYSASAVAAPSPIIKPRVCPSANVVRMHKTPTGPIGTAMANPIIRPFARKRNSIYTAFRPLRRLKTTAMTAMTSNRWINPPIVYDVTRPSNHKTTRITAIV
jgi:hypothetical protein